MRANILSESSAGNPSAGGICGVLIVTVFSVLFWLGFELKSGRLNQDASDPSIMNQSLFGIYFPGVDLQSVKPLVVAVLAIAFASAWHALSKKGRDPSPILKMSAGLLCLGIGFLTLSVGFGLSNGHPISAMWFIGLYVWHSLGELFFEPIGQGFVIANVPGRAKAFFLAVWEATAFLAFIGGNAASNVFGNQLYVFVGAAVLGAGALLLALTPAMKRLSKE